MSRTRHKMRLALSAWEIAPRWPARIITPADAPGLAVLMLDAYRGTIDDEGETLDDALREVERTFTGEYGTTLFDSSFAVEESGRLLAATLVTLWQGAPLLAFVMTASEAKGSGMATYLIQRTANAVHRAGYDELYLFVTDGNAPAEHIFSRLGFAVVRAAPETRVGS